MKLNKIIKQALYEEQEGSLRIFYSTDIFLRRTEKQMEQPIEEPEEEPTEEPAEEPAAEEEPEESVDIRGALLTEETFRTKTEGTITVPDEDAKTILTLGDLLAYVNRQTDDSGNQIINDLIIEIISALHNPNMQDQLEQLIFKGDKINATIDYGFSIEDSIGLQINKNIGVDEASLVLRQNGSATSGRFNPNVFQQKIANIFLPELN